MANDVQHGDPNMILGDALALCDRATTSPNALHSALKHYGLCRDRSLLGNSCRILHSPTWNTWAALQPNRTAGWETIQGIPTFLAGLITLTSPPTPTLVQ